MPSRGAFRPVRLPRRFALLPLALVLSTTSIAPALAAAPIAPPRTAPAHTGHLSPAAGPQQLRAVPANAFPVHHGFGDARFGVVEAFESPAQASALHVGWERVQVRWDLLQPRGPLQWDANATEHDIPYNREIAAGRQLVGVIQGVPAWAAQHPKDGNAAVPRNLDLPWNDPRNYWGGFVFRAVRHYAGRIDTFVIMNEVNIATGAYHQFAGSVTQYAQMLRVAYLAAHAANPHVEVHIYGDSVYADQGQWFRQTVDALSAFPDARANNFFFDAAEVHLYSSVLRWDTLIGTWHAIMHSHGFDRPIWLSETNVSPRDDSDPLCNCLAHPADHNALLADQPNFIVDSFAAALGLGMPRVEIYRMLDPKKIWPEHPNGLIRRDGTIRPEYYAFKTVNTWFAGVTAASYEPCNTPYYDKSCLFRVTLERPGQLLTVIWNQGGKPVDAHVQAFSQTATVVQPDGSTSSAQAKDGRFTFALPAATDHGVASDKMFDIGSTPLIVAQSLPQGQHAQGLAPLFVEQDRSAVPASQIGPANAVAVAPDGSGMRAVADTAHDRVFIEDAHGHVTAQLGGTGGAPGQFRGPSGVAIGSDGTLYVADMGNARIQEFNLQGTLLGGFGAFGFASDPLRAPSAIAAAPDNSIYVVDAAQDAVLHFSRFGVLLGRFGSPGYGSGQLDGPGGLAVDATGNVYVADTLNNRVVEFAPSGTPLAQFGTGDAGAGPDSLHWPTSVTVLADGSVAIADTANARLVVVAHPQTYVGGIDLSGISAPGGLAAAPDGTYFVSDTTANRVLHLNASGGVIAAFGTRGFGRGQFFQPLGLSLGPDGNLYVADHGNNRIEVVGTDGHWVRHIGRQGSLPGQFVGPYAVSVDADGSIWVADNGNARIQHLSAQGSVLGTPITGVNGAWGVAADYQGGVYYSAHWGQRIYHVDKAGNQQGWGAPGSGAGEFQHPGALVASATGTVYAVDEGNARVQYIMSSRIAGQRGSANPGPSGLGDPVAVAITADGSIAVLDAGRHRIVRYAGASAGGFGVTALPALPLAVGAGDAGQVDVTTLGNLSGLSAVQTVSLSATVPLSTTTGA